jgi:ABC-type transport system involved in multi-copper enzyme maturation permease subunit
MTLAIASNAWRECMRRPFAYVAVATIVALALASALLGLFAFGTGAPEAQNLAISSVLLAALVTAAFLGTALLRADLERGTFLLMMSQPVGLVAYLWGRFVGLLAVTAFVCGLTAAGVTGVLVTAGGAGDGPLFPAALLRGYCRVLLAVPVLSAAALALSALAGRIFAPVLLIALFVAGDALGASPLGRVLPAFGLFGLDASRSPPMGWLALYATLHSVVFLVITYLRLTLRAPTRTES